MADTKAKNSVQKRSVGRPRKQRPVAESVVRNGIVDSPSSESSCLELHYDQAVNLKRIFNMLKSMDARDIRFDFGLSTVVIVGQGHIGHNFARITIDCKKLNSYYCAAPFTAIIDAKKLEKVMSKIDKIHDSIYMIAKHSSFMNEIHVILEDKSHGVQEYHTIRLLESSGAFGDHLEDLKLETYSLTFTLESKYFKRVISDIMKISKDFIVERSSMAELMFPYTCETRSIQSKHIFTNPDLIDLRCTLDRSDMIQASSRIEYIQPLSSNLYSPYIGIYVDNTQRMAFKSILDQGTIVILYASDLA